MKPKEVTNYEYPEPAIFPDEQRRILLRTEAHPTGRVQLPKVLRWQKGDLLPPDENHRRLLLLQRECRPGSHPGAGAAGIHLHSTLLPKEEWTGAADQ